MKSETKVEVQRKIFIFLPIDCQLLQYYCCKGYLSSIELFCFYIKNQSGMFVSLFLGFLILFYFYCLQNAMVLPTFFCSVKIILTIPGTVSFQINYRISLSVSTKTLLRF